MDRQQTGLIGMDPTRMSLALMKELDRQADVRGDLNPVTDGEDHN